MKEQISVLISEERILKSVTALGETISRKYAGESGHLICILKGSAPFTCELAKHITVPVTMDFMSVSSYGSGTESSGQIRIKKDLDDPIKGKHILIVEDIIDSGRTLYSLSQMLKVREPASMEICTLLDKPERRVVDMEADYSCFTIPDEFVVGFGLDYDQKYRNLPFIGVLRFIED